RSIATVHDVGVFDPVSGRIVFDGFAGTRTASFPSLGLANGAPTGADATDTMVLTWTDAADGLNHGQALVQTSADHGVNWSTPVNAAQASDRPDNPAIAISPDGADVYLVYNGYLDPFQTTTANPRRMQGVARHADVGASGVLGSFTTLHRGAVGDARGSTRTLNRELIYDYQYAAASRTYGVVIWMDGRAGQRGSTNLLHAEEVRGSIPLSSELAHSSAHTGGASSAWGSRKSGTLSTTIECPRGGGHRAATRRDSVDFRIRRRAHDVE